MKYTKEDLQKITKLYIDLFLQDQGNCLESAHYWKGP